MPSKREAMRSHALSLVGCGYIYGATGWVCTQARLDQQARQYPAYAKQIYRYGPKWMGKPCYDCAQLTREVARQVGVSLPSGATSQWRATGIWKEKGTIDTLPDEAGMFLFTNKNGSMTHTGVSVGAGAEVDARGHAYGVVQRAISDTGYTHWARLNIDYDAPVQADNDEEPVEETRRTLRSGMSGDDVRAAQQYLLALGYSLGSYGADGKFGQTTKAAVIAFQKAHAITADGVIGPNTWAMFDAVNHDASSGDVPPEEPDSSSDSQEEGMLCLDAQAGEVLRAAIALAAPVSPGMMKLELTQADYLHLREALQE